MRLRRALVPGGVGLAVVLGGAVLAARVIQNPRQAARGIGDDEALNPSAAVDSDLFQGLTSDQVAIVESASLPGYREILSRGLRLRDNLDGSPDELWPFVDAIADYVPPAPTDPGAQERVHCASFALAFLARAWAQRGPFAELEPRCIALARANLLDPDEVIRLQAASLLEVIRRHSPTKKLPEPASGGLREALTDGWLSHELDRQIEVLRDAASVAGRTLPEG